ncbi:MAG: hypothetical protein ISR50_17690 [Alphaproteobacteria bacterium]|nr:hypothetical protein [Alphaproteobacteria bacterium]
MLPVMILAAMMLLGIKVVELRRGISDFAFATAWAQSDKSKGSTAKPEQAKSPAPVDEPVEKAGKIAASKSAGDADKTTARPAKVSRKTKFSPSEIEVLQKLSGRRETLEQRSRQMAMREKILQATEKRIDNKIGELKKLEGQIKGLLLEHDKENETQIKSLVKVYENMKPKQAARIFEELEMDVLLNVAERMKEVKMAKILAAMAPNKAKTLTVKLATRRPLPKTGG